MAAFPATYTAYYRLAARPYALSNAFAAAGRKQFAVIQHAATAKKWVRLRHVWVALESASAAAIVMADLIRLTDAAAATGNPAITPQKAAQAEYGVTVPAAEATSLALPTTPGTEDTAPFSGTEWNLGITAGGSTQNPPPDLLWRDLLDLASSGNIGGAVDQDVRHPIIRAGVAEGWAVTIDSNAIATIKGYVVIDFTEE